MLEARNGDHGAFDRLLPLVYEDLRQVAHRLMLRERTGHTLSTTALVHEAYLRLVDQRRVEWTDRGHFFAVAATAMRRILVDYARKYAASKRSGGLQQVQLDTVASIADERAAELMAVDEALTRLASLNERLARVVECRFFGGLTAEETATALQVTTRTVERDWAKARMWLYRELAET